jgi:hypothetical protein
VVGGTVRSAEVVWVTSTSLRRPSQGRQCSCAPHEHAPPRTTGRPSAISAPCHVHAPWCMVHPRSCPTLRVAAENVVRGREPAPLLGNLRDLELPAFSPWPGSHDRGVRPRSRPTLACGPRSGTSAQTLAKRPYVGSVRTPKSVDPHRKYMLEVGLGVPSRGGSR